MAGRKEIDLEFALRELPFGGRNADEDFRPTRSRQIGKVRLVELEVDGPEVVEVVVDNAVDAPDAGSDEGRFR
jgi:hypothetical protein